ncbi:hypothetical protein H4R23_002956 [Coemansia sp. Cherry 401B]|nr:hypothetical protein H4R23_002956 [Coemansia sp. Cherry 401B]
MARVAPRLACALARPLSTATAAADLSKLERSRAPKQQTTYKKPFNPRKQYLFSSYDTQFAQSPALLVLQHYNLSGGELLDLRRTLKEHGAHLMIVKSKMMKAVLRDTKYANLATVFTGPSAIVYWEGVEDQVAAMRKTLEIVARQRKLLVMGAKFEDVLLNAEMVREFVNLPSIDQLRAQVVGVVEMPAQQLASVLGRIPQRLVGVLGQMAAAKQE